MPQKIEISYKTIIFTVGFLISLWFLVQIREIILWVFISFILMAALKPMVDFLEQKGVPRALSALFVYLLSLGVMGFAISAVFPPLITQSVHLAESLPGLIHTLFPLFTFDSAIITQQLAPIGENILKLSIGVFSNIITIFTIFVISFYLLIERKYLEPQLEKFMGVTAAEQFVAIIVRIEERLGAWVRGQVLLMFLIGLTTFIGLTLLGIPYALSLAILAGFLELIPIIGPIISAIPGVLVAITISPLMALGTAAMYFLIQQLENNLIVPGVMKRAVGMPPIVTILALMVGGELAGMTGALLSVPIVVAAETIITEYIKLRSSE